MELFEFESSTAQALAQIKQIKEKYALMINGSNLNALQERSSRKIRYLKENNLDKMSSVNWIKENVINQTVKLCSDLIDNQSLIIDPATGEIRDAEDTCSCQNADPIAIEPNTNLEPTVISVTPRSVQTDITIPNKGNIMKESKTLSKLFESEIEKAQIVMAVRNDIVDKLQRDAEKMGNMKVDVLGPIVDRIKAEHGLEPASHFNEIVGTLLDQALSTLMDVKDKISTETLKLTGDVVDTPNMSADLGAVDEPIPEFDMPEEFGEFEPLPAEREVKESWTRLGVDLESTTGARGKKYFNSSDDMRTWLGENQHKIAKVHKIIKE